MTFSICTVFVILVPDILFLWLFEMLTFLGEDYFDNGEADFDDYADIADEDER